MPVAGDEAGRNLTSNFTNFAKPQNVPGYIENEDTYIFEGFTGLNTNPSRPAIEDQQMYWCHNWMPVGPSNLRTLPGQGETLFEATGKTITKFFFFTLGANNQLAKHYVIIFFDDGSAEIYDETDYGTIVDSLPAGTFNTVVTLNGALPGVNQFGRDYLLIVNDQENGYWIWNGSTFFTAGAIGPDPVILQPGTGYTSPPTVAASGGSGSGATFSATVSSGGIAQIQVTNSGTGYKIGDVVVLTFTGGGGNTTATATATIANGVVTSIAVNSGGSGYSQASTVVKILGGGGAGATATATVTAGAITSISVTAGGSGYISAPTVVIQDPANNIACAYVDVMPFGVSGTTVEVYTSRVWVADTARIILSSPGSVSNFAPASGAGAFRSSDSFLKEHYTKLHQSKGLLYLFADSSVNYVSGVGTAVFGNTATTTFSNINLDPQVGTSWPECVQPFAGAEVGTLIFANTYGIYALYGGQAKKISTELDGIYQTVASTEGGFSGFYPSAASAQIFGQNVYMILYPIVDPNTNQERRLLLVWNGQRWFTADQESTLTYIGTREQDSTIRAFGTDGTRLFQLFAQPSTQLEKYVRSKLWAKPSYFVNKKANRFWVIYECDSTSTITYSIDNQSGSKSVVAATTPAVVWQSNFGRAFWKSNSGGEAIWRSNIRTQFYFSDVDFTGYVLGFSAKTNAADITLISATIGFQQITQFI